MNSPFSPPVPKAGPWEQQLPNISSIQLSVLLRVVPSQKTAASPPAINPHLAERRGRDSYTGWEICVTRKQFCRNFPRNFTRISAPCLGFCQMMPRFARKYGSSGLAVVSLLSFVDLVGFGVFLPDALLAGCSSGAKGFLSHAVYVSLVSFSRTDFPGWCSIHTEECYYFYVSLPSCKGTCLLL